MNYISSANMQNQLLDRFIKYVKIWTESDSLRADNGNTPSTERQFDLAQLIKDELTVLGLQSVTVTKNCYVYAYLAATHGYENVAPFCLLAHLDTVEEVSACDVKPIVHTSYDGAPIYLNESVCLDPAKDEYLALAAKNNETIITTDGTTLLGADDKAGITEIVTALQYLVGHPEVPHGKIEVVFSPDEETGHGMDKVPLKMISSKYAYTVDGGHIGQLETECFNAYSANVIFTGKSTHTGDAKRNGLVNAISAASRFVEMLPNTERPETTSGYEGFYSPMEIQGSIEKAAVSLILRDFTEEGMENRIQTVKELAKASALSFGAKVECEFSEQYKNMKSVLQKNPLVVSKLVQAYEESGVQVEFVPIRGGTDGSRLTEMGIPTPNIFTGGHNYHSRSEWASLQQMCSACDVLINLARLVAENK